MKRLLIALSLTLISSATFAADAPTATPAENTAVAAPAPAKPKAAVLTPQMQALIAKHKNLIKRISPLAKNCLQSAPCALAGAVSTPNADGTPRTGEAIFNAVCTNCHTAGLLGSPKLGDKAAWAPRIGKGIAVLYKGAIGGVNQMPARGGNSSLSDQEVKNAVDYMISKSK